MNGNKSVTATFTPPRYTLTLTPSPSGGGSISASPPPDADGKYASGTGVQLTANANTAAGYSFSAWSGDASGSGNPVSVTMNGNKSVTADFSPETTVTVISTFAGLAGTIGSADGTGSAARFSYPHGVAVDSLGNVYVAEYGNHTIRKITPGGVVSTFAGLAGSTGSADGTASAARFDALFGVAVDSAGNVYVADLNNHTIRKITPGGVVSTLAGLPGSGGTWGQPISADGTGSVARFSYPTDVAVDSAGNVYVTDQNNHTIRKITPGGVVSTLAGLPGSSGSADGTGSAARFYYPFGVAVDSVGNLYVTDSYNDTIRKITPDGVVSTLAGVAGSIGSADGTGSAARFDHPRGVAVDRAGNVYVADWGNYTIRKITPGGVVSTFAGVAGSTGSVDGTSGSATRFNGTSGVAVDSAGNVYVADYGSHTIRKGTTVPTVSITDIQESGNDVYLSFTAVAGVAYRVESKNSLSDATWTQIDAFTSTVSGTQTVLHEGAVTQTNKFYRIKAGPNGEVVTDPAGYYRVTLNAGANAISVPLHNFATARGLVDSVSGSTVTVTGNPSWTANAFAPQNGFSQYIMLVRKDASASPGIEGDWWTIASNTGNTLTLSAGTDVLSSLLGSGDQIEIRRLSSMKDLFGTGPTLILNKDSNGNAASGDSSQADVIRFISGTSFGQPIFYHDGTILAAGYYTQGGNVGPLDGSTITVLPGQGFMVFRKSGSSATTVLVNGQVQVSRLTEYLKVGPNVIGSPFAGAAPIGSSNLKESGWVSDSDGSAAAGDFSKASLLRLITGTSFGPSVFHHDGSILQPAGWYDANGVLNNDFPLQPGRAYIFFITPPNAVRWRQAVP